MQVSILSQEKGMATVEIRVPAQVLTAALDEAYAVYAKNHEGFDAPRDQVTTSPDCQDIYRQAVQDVFSDLYTQAIGETGLQVASEPQVSVLQADEENGAVYQVAFAVRPQVTLGQYKGLRVKMPQVEPTQQEIDAAIAQAEASNATAVTVDRPAQLGDVTTIDFTGYLDGVPFEGGAGNDYPLTLGSGAFIPGFEEQLVGASAGDNVVVNVTFPENYHSADLAGKATLFRCKVKKVAAMEKTPLTEEQKQQVLSQLAQQKKAAADQKIEDEVLGRILAEAQVEIPAAMLNSEVNICMQQFVSEIGAQGMDLETFQQRTGKTTEQMLSEMQPLAKRRIMLRLVLGAIAEAEAITVTDEEVEAHWDLLAQQYGIDKPRLKVYMGEADEEIRAELRSSKAYTLLRESTILEME